ncbi:hypothetical protein QTI24_17560 [Variovorax sp. J22P240]|uniref:hypothetical protein n=1 Tax=unclassified Variovorax TaxID=663243 RepID=UPI0025755A2F|nr:MULTISPECIES: hypothetical protein [unclassified Variovorax]MDM0000431.1 hypothetical protein [Variovorax sp. J22P240]MDM0051859.1 hypothetical protein [Variovorax sp. J22R115]
MTPAKLWLQIFLAGFAIISALLVTTLAAGVPYGDLSRIGQVSDNEFGWQLAQPHVEPAFLRASPVTEADILVIGDSFSMTYRWQSVLTRAGYRVTTIYWGQLGEALCDDFDAWLDGAGFHGKLVVVESVERLLGDRLAKSQNCTKMRKPFESKSEPFTSPPEQVPGFELNWKGKLTSGYTTFRNTSRAKNSPGDTLFGKQTWARPVVGGCSFFSSKFCDKALFFKDDDDNGDLTPENVRQMRAFTNAHPARTIMWMVIPNKTTIYIQPDHSKDFVTAFRDAGLGPDLFTFAQEQKTKVRDFYFPNDTHLSMHGQLILGQRVLESVRKILPEPAAKTS